ncbi:MAG: hypothetical protein JWR16_3563 [Nevskia sp.]|nr:hypothetical protein [Nevskia sp.]
MDTQLLQAFPQPLAFVVLILGLFTVCFIALAGLIIADRLVERRAARLTRGHSLQLSFESLIDELTAYA